MNFRFITNIFMHLTCSWRNFLKISDKKWTFEISVTFYKKYKNQWQKGDFWNLSNIFQWLFEKFVVSATFFSDWRSKNSNTALLMLCSKLVNERGSGAKNPQNPVNVVYECPQRNLEIKGLRWKKIITNDRIHSLYVTMYTNSVLLYRFSRT